MVWQPKKPQDVKQQNPPWQNSCGPHVRPQAPQLLWSNARFVSHALLAFRSQSANGGEQVTTRHVPFTQALTVFGTLQLWPQAPQLLASVLRLVQVLPHATVGGGHSHL